MIVSDGENERKVGNVYNLWCINMFVNFVFGRKENGGAPKLGSLGQKWKKKSWCHIKQDFLVNSL